MFVKSMDHIYRAEYNEFLMEQLMLHDNLKEAETLKQLGNFASNMQQKANFLGWTTKENANSARITNDDSTNENKCESTNSNINTNENPNTNNNTHASEYENVSRSLIHNNRTRI